MFLIILCHFLFFYGLVLSSGISDSSNSFGLNVYEYLSADNPNENIVFSPYSLFTVLCMLLAGTGESSTSQSQLSEALQVSQLPENDVHSSIEQLSVSLIATQTTSVAQGVFLREDVTVLQSFTDLLTEYYDSETFGVQFEEPGRTEINDWVDDKTNGMIKDFIPSGVLNAQTFAVLVNALYFKNTWFNQFNEDDTVSHQFALIDEILHLGTHAVDMMHITTDTWYTEMSIGGNRFKTVSLDYQNENEPSSQFSMMLVLPPENTRASLSATENAIQSDPQSFIETPRSLTELHIKLPKFTIEFSGSEKPILRTLGVTDIFDENADLTRITTDYDLLVTDVFQKAKIVVDELGTEAAAASAVVIGETSLPPPLDENEFHLHRPFLFYLVYKPTGLMMFNGKVLQPDASTTPISVSIADYHSPTDSSLATLSNSLLIACCGLCSTILICCLGFALFYLICCGGCKKMRKHEVHSMKELEECGEVEFSETEASSESVNDEEGELMVRVEQETHHKSRSDKVC